MFSRDHVSSILKHGGFRLILRKQMISHVHPSLVSVWGIVMKIACAAKASITADRIVLAVRNANTGSMVTFNPKKLGSNHF